MGKDPRFIYDDFSDRLYISCKKPSEKIYGSVRVLNLTIDFTEERKAVAIELRGASKYLESIGIDSSILNNLSGAEIVFKQQRDGFLINFVLTSGTKVERIPYNIMTEKAVLTS